MDAFAPRALSVALAIEPAFYQHAVALSCKKAPSRRAAERRRLAARYAPRGPQKRELIEELLERVASTIEQARKQQGLPFADIRPWSLAPLANVGGCAFYPGDELREGDARRRPKRGPVHDACEALWAGAQLIARRGSGCCMRLECRSRAAVGDYCPACSSDEAVRRDHNRRVKLMEAVWASAVPHVLGGPSRVRERRIRRSSRTQELGPESSTDLVLARA
ncbi:MAG: hypothetical protein H0U03_10225 [Actinobacteria bacterium]|nr:hypothetical protein [Actinomycetota bacterium]